MYSFDLYQFLANLSLAIPNYRADPNALAMKPGKRSPAKLAVCDRFSSPQLERRHINRLFTSLNLDATEDLLIQHRRTEKRSGNVVA
jgi:hypothetical protein